MEKKDVNKILQKGLSGYGIDNSAENTEKLFEVIEDTELYSNIGKAFVEELRNMPEDELKKIVKKLKMTTDDDGEIVE